MKKQRILTKTLSVFLALLLLFLAIPITLYADVAEAVDEESNGTSVTETDNPALTRQGDEVFEDVSLREETVKHF